MRRIRMMVVVAMVLAGLAQRGAAQTDPVTVFVVRHAEKGPGNPDPDLNDDGRARATALAHLLGDAEVGVIFTSEFKRTQATAQPLATLRHLTSTVVGAAKMDELIDRLRGLAPGTRALVVSHSNLVPVIVERLSGQKVGELTDADYDRIYAVTLSPGAKASVLYFHFGAPSAAGGGRMRP
jgi:broad specificity phosphatase PhoE